MTFARTVRLFFVVVLAVGVFAWQPSLFAQAPGDARQYEPGRDVDLPSYPGDGGGWQDVPAYVSAVEGSAQLQRAGEVVRDFEQVPLEVGDRLSTARGRVEVLFSDGSVIALDEYTDITIDAEAAWRLHSGRVKVLLRSGGFELHAVPAGVARLLGSGSYRITLAGNRRGEPEVELAVTNGSAELENALGRTLVRAGTRALTTSTYAPSVPYAYTAPRDDFERWTESLEADRYGVESARYLPVELRAYGGDFDRYGSWSRYGSYGWVWYPRVSIGWQPYHSGRWSFVVNFGYSWIGGSRWEWPTHHYGRWDRAGSRWFWVPQRPVQTRRVGYAVPRRSFNTQVAYYSRPANSRPAQNILRGSSSNSGRSAAGPSRPPAAPQRSAVPRDPTAAAPQTRRTPLATRQVPSSARPSPSSVRPPTSPRPGASSRQSPGSARPGASSTRPAPSISRQAPQTRQAPPQTRQAPPQTRQAPPQTRQAPSSNRPTQSARPSEPQRSAPSVRTPARSTPQTGSRTPSGGRGAARPQTGPAGRAGTAVRRGGGRG